MKKYKTFILYIIVALSSSIIDILFFNVFLKLSLSILVSTIIARIISSLYNYTINKTKVFNNKDKVTKTILYYYLLVVITMLSSGTIVSILDKLINIPTTLIKLITDSILFVINYFIQKKIIFKNTLK